jgi:hypothetical protein
MPGWYLHDITLDTALELLGVDDQPAIMRHSEFARPDFAGVTVNLDLGDDRKPPHPSAAHRRCRARSTYRHCGGD